MDVTYHFDHMDHSYKVTFVQDRTDKINETYFVDFAVWSEGRYSYTTSFGDGKGVFEQVMKYIKEFKGDRFKIRPVNYTRYRLFRIWLTHYTNDFDIQEYEGMLDKKNFLLLRKTNENSRIKKFKDFIFNRKI